MSWRDGQTGGVWRVSGSYGTLDIRFLPQPDIEAGYIRVSFPAKGMSTYAKFPTYDLIEGYLISYSGGKHLTYSAAGSQRWYQADWIPDVHGVAGQEPTTAGKLRCVCDIHLLMRAGCQCGGE